MARTADPSPLAVGLTIRFRPRLETTLGGHADTMSILRRKVPNHYIPIHRDNINKNDWIILVEAGTIVGPSVENEKLRVAQATLERKIVKKYNLLLRAAHYLVMDGYDPRIHALYFCPQLYQFDADNQLVPLQGEEIGKLVVQAVQGGQEFDTVVVDNGPSKWKSAASASQPPM